MTARLFILVGAIAGLCIAVPSIAISAPGQLARKQLSPAVAGSFQVSFSARPFPYGYTPWSRCIRYVPVETAWGVTYRRISVCRSRR